MPATMPQTPQWQRIVGYVMVLFSVVIAVLAILHGVSRIAVLGWGGLQLPAPETWVGFQNDPDKNTFLATEVWGGFLGVWISYLCLFICLISWGMPRLGDPEELTDVQVLVSNAAAAFFALFTTFIGAFTSVSMVAQKAAIIGVPMSLIIVPVALGGLGILVVSVRSFIASFKAAQAEKPRPPVKPRQVRKPQSESTKTSAQKTGSTKTRNGKTAATSPRFPQAMKLDGSGKIVPRQAGKSGKPRKPSNTSN